MLKYYIFALIKANLIVFLIFGLLYFFGLWDIYPEYHFWVWFLINLYYQMMKPSYIKIEKMEEEWLWIRLMENKKWYHRYFDSQIRKRLNSVK